MTTPRVNDMKIAFLMSRFPKITETFILYEILGLERLGVRTEIFPLLRERQPVAHPEAERAAERARFHPFVSLPILRANWHYLRRRPGAYLGMVGEVLGGTWRSRRFFLGALAFLPKAVRFAYEMEEEGVTHVHAHFATHPTVAALVVHRLTGIPFSFTAHGSDLHVDRRMLDRKVEAAAFAVTCSNFNEEVMVEKCGPGSRDKIHVIHYGVDLEVFESDHERPAGGACRIICVASFEEVKGHRYLVDACRELRTRGVDFRCDLVGDGPLRRDVERRIAEAGLEDRFVLHGLLVRGAVADLLRAADVKVLASFPTRGGKREGMPNVLIEAMAAGLPVVSTQLTGIPELVETGRTGILVPPSDSAALADALEELIRDPELRRRMGTAGREKAVRSFDRTKNVSSLAALFGAPVDTPEDTPIEPPMDRSGAAPGDAPGAPPGGEGPSRG